MTYKKKVKITQEELNYYNSLLELDFDNEICKHDIERLGAKQDDYINIRELDFDNGNFIVIDLASGKSNYFDNIVLFDKSGNELFVMECSFEITSFDLSYNEDKYIIEFEVV